MCLVVVVAAVARACCDGGERRRRRWRSVVNLVVLKWFDFMFVVGFIVDMEWFVGWTGCCPSVIV